MPMTCTDYVAHERGFDHDHTGQRVRWRAPDGCSGTDCRECVPDDAYIVTPVDEDGIPFDPGQRHLGDALGRILRGH